MMSKRQFFSAVMIFLAVLVLFQGTQVGRYYWNPYWINKHTYETGLRVGNVRLGGSVTTEDGLEQSVSSSRSDTRERVAFVGKWDSPLGETARTWASYARYTLEVLSELPDPAGEDLPGLVLVDPDFSGDADRAKALLEQGVDLVYMDFPDENALKANASLRFLMGIQDIRSSYAQIVGIRLYPGFLLGGERYYVPQTEEEKKRDDLDLSVPWYVIRIGTKTYIQGVFGGELAKQVEQKIIRNEDLPAIAWRNSVAKGDVYVVGGHLMQDLQTGMGLLAAIMAQRGPEYLYPVVNARMFSILNYPETADENSTSYLRIYGREQTDMQRNITIPMLEAQQRQYNLALSCFMAPQLMYQEDDPPQVDLMNEYLSQLSELDGELGLSLLRRSEISLQEKLQRDEAFLEEQGSGYTIAAVCADPAELEEVTERLGTEPLERVQTVLTQPIEGVPLLSYLAENVTLQQFTANAETHTYREDLRLLGLQTALGYSNPYFDMETVLWPQSVDDQWQIKSREVFSNITTYNAAFDGFEAATASEGDTKVRKFLNLDYTVTREGDTLQVEVDGFVQSASFVLRTFGEKILEVRGGSWSELEEGSYLITVTQPEFSIDLEETEHLVYR